MTYLVTNYEDLDIPKAGKVEFQEKRLDMSTSVIVNYSSTTCVSSFIAEPRTKRRNELLKENET
jgi:precorrin-3B methylase